MANDESAPRAGQDKFQAKYTDLKDQLDSDRARREHAGRFYVPLGEVERILSETALEFLLRYYAPQRSRGDRRAAVNRILERRFEEGLSAYRFLRTFATLIHCKNRRYIEAAIKYFLDPQKHYQPGSETWKPPEDDVLLTRRSGGEKAFYNNIGIQDDGFYGTFFEQKKYFCALVLKQGSKHEVDEGVMLPFFINEDEILGQGGAGTVYKVAVGKRQWMDKWLSNPEDLLLAIKRFKPPSQDPSEDRFGNEFKTLMKLKNASIKSENVMLPLASLIHGEQRFLIYELAATQFQDYMWDSSQTYVFDADRTKAVLKNGTDLVGALRWIHHYKPYRSVCHGDIRPQNILIFRDGAREIWKLADFDRSHEKSALSETSAGRSESRQSYRAPDSKIGTRDDVWAMACMMTLILTWLSDGPRAIGEFETMRTKDDPENPDVFYNHDKPESQPCLSPEVQAWLEKLRGRAKKIESEVQPGEEGAQDMTWYSEHVGSVLDYLTRQAFVPLSTRAHADEFYRFMSDAYSRIPGTDCMEGDAVKMPKEPSPRPVPSNESTWDDMSTSSRGPSRAQSPIPSPQSGRPPQSGNRRPHALRNPTASTLNVPIPEDEALAIPRPENGESDMAPSVPESPTDECSGLCSEMDKREPPADISQYLSILNSPCRSCGDVPIHKAIRNGFEEWFAKLLATKRVDLEATCEYGGSCTPLMRSCLEDQLWAAPRLLAAGCLPRIDEKKINQRRIKKEVKRYIREMR